MKLFKNSMIFYIVLSLTACNAQIKNIKTGNVKIYGNCGMCESTIENTGNAKSEAHIEWNKDSKMAKITFDSTKTNQDEILKRIALGGYDNDKFLAPDDVYSKLPACCQYERTNKGEASMGNMTMETMLSMKIPIAENVVKASPMNPNETMSEMQMPTTKVAESKVKTETTSSKTVVQEPAKKPATSQPTTTTTTTTQESNLLIPVFEIYFALKDALVQTNGEVASAKAKSLLTAIIAVKMDKLPMAVHMVWMKAMPILKQNATAMANSKEIETQRSQFINLSKYMYDVIMVEKYEVTVYYQFCPMANGGKGANWLSKEKVVKNPYYGSQMLSCGKVVETIK